MIINGLDRVSDQQTAISILGKVAERRMVPHLAEKSGYYPPIMENQMEKRMENEMETGFILGVIGVIV